MSIVHSAITTVKSTGLNAGDFINAAVGVSDYKEAREQGKGRVRSLAKAGISFAWGEFYYGGMSSAIYDGLQKAPSAWVKKHAGGLSLPASMLLMMAPMAATVVGATTQNGSKARTKQWANRGQLGSGYFNMSEAGYTMRQRSLNAIRQNGLNTQSVLGNEARTYFRW